MELGSRELDKQLDGLLECPVRLDGVEIQARITRKLAESAGVHIDKQ